METLECIRSRRSVRSFHDTPIPRKLVEQLIDAARWAPSYNNTKIARFVAIDSPQAILHVAQHLIAEENRHIVEKAPLLLVVSVVKGRSGRMRDGSFETDKGSSWEMFDAGIACQNISLAAGDLGLGSVMMATFDEQGMASFAALPADEEVIIVMALGYPAKTPPAPRRKEVHEILRFM